MNFILQSHNLVPLVLDLLHILLLPQSRLVECRLVQLDKLFEVLAFCLELLDRPQERCMLHLLILNTMLRLFDFFLNRCQVDRRYLAQLSLEILDFQRLFFKTILEVKNALATLIFKFIYLQAVLFSNLGYFLLEIRYDLLFV